MLEQPLANNVTIDVFGLCIAFRLLSVLWKPCCCLAQVEDIIVTAGAKGRYYRILPNSDFEIAFIQFICFVGIGDLQVFSWCHYHCGCSCCHPINGVATIISTTTFTTNIFMNADVFVIAISVFIFVLAFSSIFVAISIAVVVPVVKVLWINKQLFMELFYYYQVYEPSVFVNCDSD